MKKKLVTLLIGVCAASMLTACNGAGGGGKEIKNEYVTISQYKGIEVQKVDVMEVTDENVEQSIQSTLEMNAKNTPITDRPAQEGDSITFDYEGKLDGVAFEGGTATNQQMVIGEANFIEGFQESFIGHNAGEEFDVPLRFPEEYQAADLAGKEVVFTMKLNEVSEKEVPELNDDFVKSVSEKSETVEEYKKETKKQLEKSNKESAEATLKASAWSKVLESAKVTKYPDGEVDEVKKSFIDQYKSMAEAYEMEYADFLKERMGSSEEDFEKQVDEAAKEQVKQKLVAELIAEKEKLTLSDDDYKKEFKEYAKKYGYPDADSFVEMYGEDVLKDTILADKVKEWLVENCKQVDQVEEPEAEEPKNTEEDTAKDEDKAEESEVAEEDTKADEAVNDEAAGAEDEGSQDNAEENPEE